MNENKSNSNNENSNSNSWLGFSLSPHMKMEVPSPSSTTAAMESSFHLCPSLCYGGVGEASAFHFPLPIMPLKSDGSLCFMQPLSRSQPNGMVTNGSPKLEDFLGNATMEDNQFASHEREAMALSLDSIYYNTPDPPPPQTHHPYYSTLQCHDLIADCVETELMKNWFSVGQFGGQQGVDYHHHPGGGVGCNELQSLSLSMSPGSQSSCVTAARQISPTELECVAMESKKRASMKVVPKQPVHRKSIDTFGQRTSQYRGVTRHRWTGRYEAHLWDNSCKKEGQTRKGKQVYLGGYDMEEKAARAYDLAALKYWGLSTHINFPLENYQKELEEMKNMTRQEYVAHLRRKSSGFSRGASIYRGVTRHHQHGRWQARIGRVAGNKDLYLGTFSTQEEAAEAYDIAAIKFRGVNAVTNFDISRYNVEKIMASNTLPSGDLARRQKDREPTTVEAIEHSSIVALPPQHNEDWNNNMMVMSQNESTLQQDRALNIMGNYNHQKPFPVVGSLHDVVFDNNTISNPSSLVTSLGSSREGSPDKNGTGTMVFNAKANGNSNNSNSNSDGNNAMGTKFLIPGGNASPCISNSIAHLPLYGAWNDDENKQQL